VIVQPLSGAWLIFHGGFAWNVNWLVLTYALYMLAGACWLPAVAIQMRMKAMLEAQARGLESVSKLHQGLQSFRSMRRMEASFRNARALRLRFSQSLARRRQRLSHAMVRSTIQRLGNFTNPLA